MVNLNDVIYVNSTFEELRKSSVVLSPKTKTCLGSPCKHRNLPWLHLVDVLSLPLGGAELPGTQVVEPEGQFNSIDIFGMSLNMLLIMLGVLDGCLGRTR